MLNIVIETAIYFGILWGGYRYGAGPGAALGTALGIIETIRLKNLGALGIMSIMGTLAGLFAPIGRLSSVTAYLAGAFSIGSLYAPELFPSMLPGLLVSVMAFIMIPTPLCTPVTRGVVKKKNYIEDGSVSVKGLKEMAGTLHQVSKNFEKSQEEDNQIPKEDAIAAFEMAATMVCQDCRNCNLCKTSGQGENYYLYYLLQAFEEQGILTQEDMPKLFSEACERQEIYMDQLNYNLGKAKNNLEWKNRFLESREAVAVQFKEFSNIMEHFSKKMGMVTDITSDVDKPIKKVLRNKRIRWDRLVVLEYDNHRKEIYLSASAPKGTCVTAKDLADSIGRVLECRLRPSGESKNVVHREKGMIHLVEDSYFMMLHGVAKAVKGNGEVSGDNFSFRQLPDGKVLLGLSDGMGSGAEACKESEKVIELAESLLETGFSMESAVKMVHSVLLLDVKEQRPTTLDLAMIDLYTGIFEGMKFGASDTFILHRNLGEVVEIVKAENLPMGILHEIDPITTIRKLADGDTIIMVTDGVLEAFEGEDKELAMKDFLEEIEVENPGDIADTILQYACGGNDEPRDDMLILVAGIWEKQ